MNCAPKLGRFILYGSRYAASCRASSPLTRGKRDRRRGGSHRWGLIPAHAGKTRCTPRPRRLCPAHPRSRGENCSARSATICLSGSSPLTRGKLRRGIRRFKKERLIPAHAGKTPCGAARRAGTPAHPRSRGENVRVLGARSSVELITAHAGKTRVARGVRRAIAAHPRSRGENYKSATLTRSSSGSSPLTPGKLVRFAPGKVHQGLIPAHAGKTACHPLTQGRRGAHPRSREENIDAWKLPERHVGSSPLTRGKRYSVHRLTCACGFIPAHAGKTSHDPAHQSASTAHPRSRRENDLTEPIMELMPGSSPLTQGKRRMILPTSRPVRLIPAHAGKTI